MDSSAQHLVNQLAQLSVNTNGPSNNFLSNGAAGQRLRSKRSQRFTVPVQPPNATASPPFSTSDESSAATSTSDALMFPSSSNTSNSFQSNNDGMFMQQQQSPTKFGGMFPPSNFAQTGPPPAFLQQDPFAFAGGLGNAASNGSRTRTLSAGSNHSAAGWSDRQQQPYHHSQPSGLAHQAGYPGSLFDSLPNVNNMRNIFQAGNMLPQGNLSGNIQAHHPGNQLPQQQQYQQHLPEQASNGAAGADDIIPTAIVIKNIPFTFPSTSLLQIIEELTLAPPYAFNYHYDTGVFRGLAFANFHTPQETDACVAALNGFEIQGRKLRVEYKKVLQAGEKERIERDKAIKRMRSMQLERERLLHQQSQLQQQFLNNKLQMPLPQPNNIHQPQHQEEQWEDYGRTIHPSNSMFHNAVSPPLSSHSPYIPPGSASVTSSADVPASSAASNSGRSAASSGHEIDMNDPHTLEIYSRVLLFKDDAMRDELAFSRSLNSLQRRTVHLIAQRLGLGHKSVGTGDERYVVVLKGQSLEEQPQQRLRSRASAHHLLKPDTYSPAPPSGGLTAAALRKKSMPDLRHQQGRSAYSFQNQDCFGTAPPVPAFPSSSSSASITPRHSAHDLRTGEPRSAVFSDFMIPPVPALPTSLSSTMNPAQSQQPNGIQSPPPNSSSRHSLLFNLPALGPAPIEANEDMGLSRAVGSPVNGGSNLQHQSSLTNLLRQPKGPDSSTSWARAVANGNSASVSAQ